MKIAVANGTKLNSYYGGQVISFNKGSTGGNNGYTSSGVDGEYRSSTIYTDNDWNNEYSGMMISEFNATLKLSNVIAHEILHGFLERAMLKTGVRSAVKLDAGGHTIGPKNLLTDRSYRLGTGESKFKDDWINSDANKVLSEFRNIINNYLGK